MNSSVYIDYINTSLQSQQERTMTFKWKAAFMHDNTPVNAALTYTEYLNMRLMLAPPTALSLVLPYFYFILSISLRTFSDL